jgi:hypothetical protein
MYTYQYGDSVLTHDAAIRQVQIKLRCSILVI